MLFISNAHLEHLVYLLFYILARSPDEVLVRYRRVSSVFKKKKSMTTACDEVGEYCNQGSRLTFSQVTLVPPNFSFSSTKTNKEAPFFFCEREFLFSDVVGGVKLDDYFFILRRAIALIYPIK